MPTPWSMVIAPRGPGRVALLLATECARRAAGCRKEGHVAASAMAKAGFAWGFGFRGRSPDTLMLLSLREKAAEPDERRAEETGEVM